MCIVLQFPRPAHAVAAPEVPAAPAAVPAPQPAPAPVKGALRVLTDAVPFCSTAGTLHNAEVVPGVQIRIWGVVTGRLKYGEPIGPVTFDRTFEVGAVVEYGSYNLKYTGKITNIGKATITVERSGTGDRAKRMKVAEFAARNWDLDLAEIARRNGEWMD